MQNCVEDRIHQKEVQNIFEVNILMFWELLVPWKKPIHMNIKHALSGESGNLSSLI